MLTTIKRWWSGIKPMPLSEIHRRRVQEHQVPEAPQFVEPSLKPMSDYEESRLYEITKKYVQKADRTGSLGDDKRLFVVAAVFAEYRHRGLRDPKKADIHLAIEVAVRELS